MQRYGNDYMRRGMSDRYSMRGYDAGMGMGDRFMGGRDFGGARDWNAGGRSYRAESEMGRGWQGQDWGGARDWGTGYDAEFRGTNRGYGGERTRYISAGRGDMDRVHYADRGDRDLGDRMRSGWSELKRNARDMFGSDRGYHRGYDRGW